MCVNAMSDTDQYDRVYKGEFAAINVKLDRLDEAIRGNGKPGIQLRLGRLEASEKSRAHLIWIILGSAVTPLFDHRPEDFSAFGILCRTAAELFLSRPPRLRLSTHSQSLQWMT